VRAGLAALVSALLTLPGGRARPAERTASWVIDRLDVVSEGHRRLLPEGRLVEGFTLQAPVEAREGAPLGDGVLVVQLSAFSPANDLPRQPKGLWYVKGTWRLVAAGSQTPASVRHAPDVLQGLVSAALPVDPTAGDGAFTLRARVAAGSHRQVRAGDGALTVNAERAAELVLTLR
jgi:hypothetical protein